MVRLLHQGSLCVLDVSLSVLGFGHFGPDHLELQSALVTVVWWLRRWLASAAAVVCFFIFIFFIGQLWWQRMVAAGV